MTQTWFSVKHAKDGIMHYSCMGFKQKRDIMEVWLPYSGKFSRVLIFAVFADQGETAKFYTSKIFNLLLYV